MLVFVMIALAGLLFLLVSALFGGQDDFAEHEFSAEAGYEAGGDVDAGPSPFSIRILSLFATAFGAVGAITRYYGQSYPVSSAAGVLSGLVFGFLGWQLIRLFWKQQASSTVESGELIGATGVVKTAIPASGTGEISVELKQQRLYMPARSKDGGPVAEGAFVRITANPGGAAVVEMVEEK
ncbi:MAG: NfeD family protein [Nitrospirae bacterium]|nr:NfeD family protein [Nitrospirota bacterium]